MDSSSAHTQVAPNSQRFTVYDVKYWISRVGVPLKESQDFSTNHTPHTHEESGFGKIWRLFFSQSICCFITFISFLVPYLFTPCFPVHFAVRFFPLGFKNTKNFLFPFFSTWSYRVSHGCCCVPQKPLTRLPAAGGGVFRFFSFLPSFSIPLTLFSPT